MGWPKPNFTKLDLNVLDADFAQCEKAKKALPMSLDRSKKVAQVINQCIVDAKKEIDRQIAIYDKEQAAYIAHVKTLHADSKQASAALIAAIGNLQKQWDDKLFMTMPALQAKLHENRESASEWGKALPAAHLKFRENNAWTAKTASEALGADEAEKLRQYFIAGRAGMIAAMGEIKTYVVKLEEFKARGDDCLKAAMALKTQSAAAATDFMADIKTLTTETNSKAGDCDGHASKWVKQMQNFVVLCNRNKDKVKEDDYKTAVRDLQAVDLIIKNDKTYLKTLKTKLDNLGTRTKATPPTTDALKQIAAIAKSLQVMGDNIKSMQTGRDAFAKKIADAKAASGF